MKGSVGDWTYSRKGGKTIAKQKVEEKETPSRTLAQMMTRVLWRNIQNLWTAFTGRLRRSFEARPQNWTDANAFMSANFGRQGVYLTREQASQGACVVAGYQITRGTLPSIDTEIANGVGKSDISVGSLALDEETTVADFSNAIVQNNSDWEYGDQLSCFILEQRVNSVTGIPYVAVHAYEITLDGNNTDELLADVVSAEAFSVVDNKVGTGAAINGGVAYVHSRKQANRIAVSTQNIVVANSILAQYQSDTARTAAIISYGGETSDVFLTPNIDDIVAPD